MIAAPAPSRDRPLEGRTVVVTRPRSRAGGFESMLRSRGARVLSFPTIRIVPLEDPHPLREALAGASSYDWIVFTSVNGVAAVRAARDAADIDREGLLGPAVAAIGPATAGAVREELGLEASVMPDTYRAESLAAALLAADAAPSGKRVLLPRASGAREVLPRLLEEAGMRVTEVVAYHTALADAGRADAFRNRLRAGEIDWVTFTASSTVRGFVEAVGTDTGGGRIAAIGPITADTARDLGLSVDVVASEYTIPGLVDALVEAEATSRPGGRHG